MRSACLLALLLSACVTYECEVHNPHVGDPLNPSIESLQVSGSTQGNGGTVSVGLQVPGFKNLRVRDVVLEVRSTATDNLPFELVGEMEEVGNLQFQGTLPSLQYGPYEVCVKATLRRGPVLEPAPEPDLILVERAELFSHAGPDCFTFVQEETSGWTTEGVFEVGGEQIVPPGSMFLGGGNFGAGVGLLCLPNVPPGPPGGGLWYFDYISPPMADLGQWQIATEAVVKMSAQGEVKVQPIFTYLEDDGIEHLYAEQANEDFDVVQGTHEFTDPTFNAGQGPLIRLRVRVFGDYMLTTPETWVNLHFVCPRHESE